MFSSQQLNCKSFLMGLKHGVYVFTNDVCQFCTDYKKSIEHINNANLYFVECVTEQEKELIFKITNRLTFPITAAFVDGDIQWTRIGQLFGEDLEFVLNYLNDTFGEAPLTQEEKRKKEAMIKNRCILTFYVFPPELSLAKRFEAMADAPNHGELPIDVDSFGFVEDEEVRERMLASNYGTSNMVIFNAESTDRYSEFAMKVINGYVTGRKMQFTTRSI